jgi:hypothetical protein
MLPGNAQQDYCGFIKQYLEAPTFAVTGVHLRVFSMLGDRVAVALLKALHPARELQDLKLKKSLLAICESFRHLDSIEKYSDRTPAVTLCLLEVLMAGAQLSEHTESIRSAMEIVNNFTKPPAQPTNE